jgi:hypothetical protein
MNNKLRYTLTALITGTIVGCSVLLPGIFLHKMDYGIIGYSHIAENGYATPKNTGNPSSNPSASSPSASPSAVPDDDRMKQYIENIRIFERGEKRSQLSGNLVDGNLSTREAVDTGVSYISNLLDENALLPLDEFPKAYEVSVEMREITGEKSDDTMQYYIISFSNDNTSSKIQTGIMIMLDAKTGMILYAQSMIDHIDSIDTTASIQAITSKLHLDGMLQSTSENENTQTALWAFKDSDLVFRLCVGKRTLSSFLMIEVGSVDYINSNPPLWR